MSLLINNVKCDAFAYLDRHIVSDTVNLSLSKTTDWNIVAFLFCNTSAFPVSSECTAECCIVSSLGVTTVVCGVGASGEIRIPIPEKLRVENERLSCEINISGIADDGMGFRYKAATFLVAITR